MTNAPATPRVPDLQVEDADQVVSHGPMGSAPFSRRLRLRLRGQEVEVQTRPFPTDHAAREAARALRQALRHAFG